jgi:hypothetical protein
LLVDGVVRVGFEGGAIGKFHDAAKVVSLRARGEVEAGIGFEEIRDLALERLNFGLDTLLLSVSGIGFPAEVEGMDDHADIVVEPFRP